MLTLVDCGRSVKTRISFKVPPGSSVTVEFGSADESQIDKYTPLDADAYPERRDRLLVGSLDKDGIPSVGGVHGRLYYGGYDISFGTVERGITIVSPFGASHIVIVIRGVTGLEVVLRTDKNLIPGDVTKARDVFDYRIDRVARQWSRTIRDLARVDGLPLVI
ncbi:hypothetical protein E4T44_11712 [Aureobasidium sp. EXF-8845]|nr:hypothetical protein E4T45_11595 [Aureobasidium sp. EXF-8846]KAI4800693.1 hypothetical protein E4T44_11712 [Aureobasidium sp. EXF-8845]